MIFNLKTGLMAAMVVKMAQALDTIEVVENKFFFSNNGSQFYIRGVAYQADTAGTNDTFVDPLADATTCKRDIPYLQDLNTNVVRVYALDADADHSECMSLLEDAGIYVIADLSDPQVSISTTDPAWSVELYERYASVIDNMNSYDNVLGFFAGNEVITNNTNTDAAPFVKAAIRDMKAYMEEQGYRSIPVGYSANDDSDTRVYSADYFTCGDEDIRADFYGINMYEWCGSSNFKTSGYQQRTEEFSNLTVPAFFSEYGCNAVQPRKFTEIGTLFSDDMTDVWSGGIVYMYYEETNDYGLVSEIDSTSVSTLTDYQYYSSEINNISPTSASVAGLSTTGATLKCPSTAKYWKANTALPPTPQQAVCNCANAAAACVVSDDVDSDDYATLFSYICSEIDCAGITADGETGEYGAYSFCSAKEQLNFVMNLYYVSNGSNDDSCDFDGSATLVEPSTASSCDAVLAEAGVTGVGSVTVSLPYVTATYTDDDDAAPATVGSESASSTAEASASGSSSSASASSSSSSSSSSSGAAKANGNIASLLTVTLALVAGGAVLLF